MFNIFSRYTLFESKIHWIIKVNGGLPGLQSTLVVTRQLLENPNKTPRGIQNRLSNLDEKDELIKAIELYA